MATTVTALQTLVQWESRDTQFSLTDATGLSVFNALYRRLAALIDWPELNREDTSLSTVANTEKYTWPATYEYIDTKMIEVQDPYDNLKYKQISSAPSELEFNLQRNMPADFPILYKKAHDGTDHIIYLAPKPVVGSLTIRIIGQIEPTAVTAGADTTVFVSKSADDALVYLIAADISDKRAQPQRAASLVGRAAEVLSRIAGREITPDELRNRVLANAGD